MWTESKTRPEGSRAFESAARGGSVESTCGDLQLEEYNLLCKGLSRPTLELVLTGKDSRYRGLLPVTGKEYLAERPFVDATLRAAEKAICNELTLRTPREIPILECGGIEAVTARGRAGYRVTVRAWISGELYEEVGVDKGKGRTRSSIAAALHAVRRICRNHARGRERTVDPPATGRPTRPRSIGSPPPRAGAR